MELGCKFKLDKWRLNEEKNLLIKGNQQLSLKPLLTKLLAYFLANAGAVQSIDVLKAEVWQQEFLTDSAVKKAISELRKILALTGINDGELIKTEPQLGYRYVGPVELVSTSIFYIYQPYIAKLIALTFSIFVILLIFSQPSSITLVEKTENIWPGSQEQAYTELIRATLISALSPHYSVRQLYTKPDSAELVISYLVDDSNRLSISLHDKSNELLWEKRLVLDNKIHQSLSTVVDELSRLLKKSLTAPALTVLNHPEAYELFVKGKISYYQQGIESDKAALLFKRSLQLQPQNNPSNAALLDIYGLKSRSKQYSQRDQSLQLMLEDQVKLVKSNAGVIPENVVALAKYSLVNRGDSAGALAIINEYSGQLTQAYDLHIIAFSYALNGDKKNSNFFIELAEQRFPQRNVVLWYKVMIHLINGDLNSAKIQSQWAQDIAPDWYPLNYIAPRLFSHDENSVLNYMVSYPEVLLDSNFSSEFDLAGNVEHYFRFLEQDNVDPNDLNFKRWQPSEAEIAYLLAKFYNRKSAEKYIMRYVNFHYPEKLMMLKMIDQWFALYR